MQERERSPRCGEWGLMVLDPRARPVQTRPPRGWGGTKHPRHIFYFTLRLWNNAKQQMSVTKKLKNKGTHKT